MGNTALRLALRCAVLLALGCGAAPSKAVVTGRVTYKGKPVRSGTVTFHGTDGGSATARLRADGTFTMRDVPRGEVRATVRASTAGLPGFKESDEWVPGYGHPDGSGLRYTIAGPTQAVEVELGVP